MSYKKRILVEILVSMAIPVLCTCARMVRDIKGGYEPNLLSMALYVLLLSITTFPFLFLKNMKRKSNGFVVVMICVLVAMDQLVKVIVHKQGEFEIELISGGLSIMPSCNIYNTALLSVLHLEINTIVISGFKILAGMIMLVGIYLVLKKSKTVDAGVLLVLLGSGVFSSLVDSLVWGYTLDYIRFPFYTVIDLKDIYVFVGVNLFIVYLLRAYVGQREPKIIE